MEDKKKKGILSSQSSHIMLGLRTRVCTFSPKRTLVNVIVDYLSLPDLLPAARMMVLLITWHVFQLPSQAYYYLRRPSMYFTRFFL